MSTVKSPMRVTRGCVLRRADRADDQLLCRPLPSVTRMTLVSSGDASRNASRARCPAFRRAAARVDEVEAVVAGDPTSAPAAADAAISPFGADELSADVHGQLIERAATAIRRAVHAPSPPPVARAAARRAGRATSRAPTPATLTAPASSPLSSASRTASTDVDGDVALPFRRRRAEVRREQHIRARCAAGCRRPAAPSSTRRAPRRARWPLVERLRRAPLSSMMPPRAKFATIDAALQQRELVGIRSSRASRR